MAGDSNGEVERGEPPLPLHGSGALVERPRRHRGGSGLADPGCVLDSGPAADPGPHQEGADLRGRREERLARHGNVEGEVVPADAAEADLRRAIPLDEADELSPRHAEDSSARSAVADWSVGLHRPLLPGIAVDDFELTDDSRADAEGAPIGSADHDDVVADLRIEG